MISFAILAVTVATSLAGGETVAFRGTLGDLPIRMTLTQHERKIGGFYLYESRFVPISLDGTIQPSRRVRLADSEHPQRPEKFEGRISGARFVGTWTSADGRTKQRFALREERDPTRAPGTWKPFRQRGCPITFKVPSAWTPKVDEAGVLLAAVSRGFDDDLHASWGGMDRDPPRYRKQGEGWFYTDESGDHPIAGPVRRDPSVHGSVLGRGDGISTGIDGLEASDDQRARAAPLDRRDTARGAKAVAGPWRAVNDQAVGGVDPARSKGGGDDALAQRQRGRPFVAHREQRVGLRPSSGQRVEVPRSALAQRRRVRHQPAGVDLVGHRPDHGPDEVGGDGGGRGRRRHGRGKFMASTKICSKSGCAASETCSMRRAIESARARSGSDSRQSWAPSEAALPTYRTRP